MPLLPRYWWSDMSNEDLWIEISDRDDFGANLTHFVEAANGAVLPSYHLARDEMNIGDIVFHFDQHWDGIRSWSSVAGSFQEHGDAWEVELDGPNRLRPAIPYNRLVDAEVQITEVLDSLPRSREPARHLPFALKSDGLHLAQTYLAKLPRGLVTIFPQLATPPGA
jgi:hypothetical protein